MRLTVDSARRRSLEILFQLMLLSFTRKKLKRYYFTYILVVCSFLFSLSPARKKTAPVSMPGASSSKQSLDPQPGSLPYSAFIEACDSGKQNFSLKRCTTQFDKNNLRILFFILFVSGSLLYYQFG